MAERRLVLVVEDDPSVQRVTVRIVESFGYEAMGANGIRDAIATLEQRHEELTCVLLDYSLRGETGVDALEKLRALVPGLPVLMLSGFPREDVVAQIGRHTGVTFLQKPYRADELQVEVERCRRA